MDELELDQMRAHLVALKLEHGDLDAVISQLQENRVRNELQIQRLKKRKLQLKDEINRIESILLPDIIA